MSQFKIHEIEDTPQALDAYLTLSDLLAKTLLSAQEQ
jgi:hypothetical protein